MSFWSRFAQLFRSGDNHRGRAETILFAWELGRGLGHIQRLLPIATALAQRGHQIVFAFRSEEDAAIVRRALPKARVLLAPVYRGDPGLESNGDGPAHTYADVLFCSGYHSRAALEPLVRGWHQLFAEIEPALVVCDHSPTAVLAARERLPVIHVGSGFANPPPAQAFKVLHQKTAAGAAEREAQVLAAIREVQAHLGAKPIEAVAELFGLAETFACCLPELDPYRAVRTTPAIGPVAALPKPSTPPQARNLFAYLAGDDPRVGILLERLIRAKVTCNAYIPQCPPEWEEKAERTTVRIFDEPQNLPDALAAAAGVVHHGGLATTEMALAIGRPQFLLPRYLEQTLTANAVQELRCGVNLARERSDPALFMRETLDHRVLAAPVARAAEKIASTPRQDVCARIVQACLRHLT